MTAEPRRSRPLRAVVTSGGTEEPVDDVRFVTNFSTGRFGAAIARALVRGGVETTLLASRALTARSEELRGRMRVVPYASFRDLEIALADLASDPPDIVLMAAAVSDYSPVRAPGKIRSDAAALTIALVANPKLLPTLRGALGDRVVLVGFKLLSGVPSDELLAVARAQIASGRLDLSVANDLRELEGDRHPVWLVPSSGEARRIEGQREDVAEEIAHAAIDLARHRGARAPASSPDLAAQIARCADQIGLPASSRAIRVRDAGSPSHLLDTVDGVDAILMVDDALGRFDATLPHGASPSDEAVRAALAEAARGGRWGGGPFSVRLEGGAALFGLGRDTCEALVAGMCAAREELCRRLGCESDEHRALLDQHTTPIFDGTRIVGAAVHLNEGVIAPVVIGGPPSGGLGDAVLSQLDERGCAIAVRAFDENYARERGFKRGARELKTLLPEGAPCAWSADGLVLEPPSRATTLTLAASVALVDPLRRRVLLGKRRIAPFEGYHAFPGGKVEPGETARAAAARELAEETGIALPASLSPRRVVRVFVSDGLRVFAVDCHVFFVLTLPMPVASTEMEAEWLPIDRARRARPVAAGTRRVLREIEAMVRGA